jgi:hypothetical protein
VALAVIGIRGYRGRVLAHRCHGHEPVPCIIRVRIRAVARQVAGSIVGKACRSDLVGLVVRLLPTWENRSSQFCGRGCDRIQELTLVPGFDCMPQLTPKFFVPFFPI